MGNPAKKEGLLTCSHLDWGRASLPVEGWEESTYFLWPDATTTTQSAKEEFPLSLVTHTVLMALVIMTARHRTFATKPW